LPAGWVSAAERLCFARYFSSFLVITQAGKRWSTQFLIAYSIHLMPIATGWLILSQNPRRFGIFGKNELALVNVNVLGILIVAKR
jgi:hypothetical protein